VPAEVETLCLGSRSPPSSGSIDARRPGTARFRARRDFSGLTGGRISSLGGRHKAFVDVNEEGTGPPLPPAWAWPDRRVAAATFASSTRLPIAPANGRDFPRRVADRRADRCRWGSPFEGDRA
jgi:hypothetical protein